LQAAYARQFLEQVSRRQTQMAGAAPAAPDHEEVLDNKKWGSESEKRLKTEGGWAPTSVKPEAVPLVTHSLSISSLQSGASTLLGLVLLAAAEADVAFWHKSITGSCHDHQKP